MKTELSFRELIYKLLSKTFLQATANGKKFAENIAIITMHGLYNDAMREKAPPPRRCVSEKTVRDNLIAIKKNFSIISLKKAVKMIGGDIPWEKNCVVVTFDDSDKSMRTVALPLVKSLDIIATFFISTHVISTQTAYWWRRLEFTFENIGDKKIDVELPNGKNFSVTKNTANNMLALIKKEVVWLSPEEIEAVVAEIENRIGISLNDNLSADPYGNILTWDDVKYMFNQEMEIGSHTVTHPNLKMLDSDKVKSEISNSKCVIENNIKMKCNHFCYPGGFFSPKTTNIIKESGYNSAVTTIQPGWNSHGSDIYMLRRFNMPKESFKLPYLFFRE